MTNLFQKKANTVRRKEESYNTKKEREIDD